MKEAETVGIGRKKSFFGCKHKFGFDCQAVADVRGNILDISITYGRSSSDCLAFKESDLCRQLENGLLRNEYVLFDDKAYLNLSYIAAPYSIVGDGSKDD